MATSGVGGLSSPIVRGLSGGISSAVIDFKGDISPIVIIDLNGNTINSPNSIDISFSGYKEGTMGLLKIKRNINQSKFLYLPFIPGNPSKKEVDFSTGGSMIIASFVFLEGSFGYNFWF